jgi:hypothetical protein
MDFLSYPYGLGPWHASTGNKILKLRTIFRYVIEHLGREICLLQGLCRDRTPKTHRIICALILTKTSIYVLPACAVSSSGILRRIFIKEYIFFSILFSNSLSLCPSLNIFQKLGAKIMPLGTT